MADDYLLLREREEGLIRIICYYYQTCVEHSPYIQSTMLGGMDVSILRHGTYLPANVKGIQAHLTSEVEPIRIGVRTSNNLSHWT